MRLLVGVDAVPAQQGFEVLEALLGVDGALLPFVHRRLQFRGQGEQLAAEPVSRPLIEDGDLDLQFRDQQPAVGVRLDGDVARAVAVVERQLLLIGVEGEVVGNLQLLLVLGNKFFPTSTQILVTRRREKAAG